MSARAEVIEVEHEPIGTALVSREQRHAISGERDSVTNLLMEAVRSGTSVEQLERLVDLHERMEARQAIRDFYAALSRFKAKCPQINKAKTAEVTTKSGGKWTFTYADLPEIQSTIDPLLAEEGLSYGWDSKEEKGSLLCVCTLRHIGGHSTTSSLTLSTESSSPMSPQQKVGAALTYASRRTLGQVLGLNIGDAETRPAEVDPTQVTDDQAMAIEDMLVESGANRAKFLKYMEAVDVYAIRAADFDKAMTALEAFAQKKGGAK